MKGNENIISSAEKPLSPAAQRMRGTRYRRALGLRCIRFEIHDDQINALIGRRLLSPDKRNDPDAIAEALYVIVDGVLPPPGLTNILGSRQVNE